MKRSTTISWQLWAALSVSVVWGIAGWFAPVGPAIVGLAAGAIECAQTKSVPGCSFGRAESGQVTFGPLETYRFAEKNVHRRRRRPPLKAQNLTELRLPGSSSLLLGRASNWPRSNHIYVPSFRAPPAV
jgi:hypothetical protein